MLTEHQEWHLKQLLDGIGENRKKLNLKETEFIDQMIERFDKFERNLFISAKQLNWLEKIYTTHVGPLQ